MDKLLVAIRHLPTGKKIVVIAMLVLIVLTWLGVCAIFASYVIA